MRFVKIIIFLISVSIAAAGIQNKRILPLQISEFKYSPASDSFPSLEVSWDSVEIDQTEYVGKGSRILVEANPFPT